MEIWRLIDSGKCDAAYNMALDEAIAIHVRRGRSQPTLRLYGWKGPSVSLGSFQKITDINSEYCAANDVMIVRRLTGGRAVLHEEELTYSFCSRNKDVFSRGLLETYRQLSMAFASALEMIGLNVEMKTERGSGRGPNRDLARSPLCFRSASYGEISMDAKKLVGSAQKRWADGFLQQGSIPYSIDRDKLEAVFKLDGAESAFVGLKDIVDFEHEELKSNLRLSFERNFDITLVASHPSAQEEELAHQLSAQKYLSPHWTLGATANMRCYSSNGIVQQA